jgi:beta-carotene 3-hydroxylase
MHGVLWVLHKDHHTPYKKTFEKNDLFFLIFAIPSATLMIYGILYNDYRLFIGTGILMYGIAYFIVHDVIIHQRMEISFLKDNNYVKAIRKAHKIHHKNQNRKNGVNFGMLWVPPKYFKEAYRQQLFAKTG